MSNERAAYMRALSPGSRSGVGISDSIASMRRSILIDLLLCGDGDDRRVLRNRALDKLLNLAVVVDGAVAVDQIDLVLCDDDVLDPDEIERHQVLFRLRLRDVLGCAHDEHGSVHDRGSREHRCHQRLVARARQRTRPSGSARSLNRPRTPRRRCNTRARRRRDSAGTLRPRTPAGWRYRVSFFLAVLVGPRAGQRLHERRLPVVDVTDETDVHLRLCVDFSHCWTS